jgi:hypothetical protein
LRGSGCGMRRNREAQLNDQAPKFICQRRSAFPSFIGGDVIVSHRIGHQT